VIEQEEGFGLIFDEPQKPTAPGQVAALYAGEELLGGGVIAAVE
jgi:tRNA-specific 2-thiouridylase